MTLKSTLLLSFAAMMLMTAAAEAQIVPGPRPPSRPRPGNPPPPPPGSGYPGNPGSGVTEQKVIRMNRQVFNTRLDLKSLAGLDRRYDGYNVESVTIVTRGNAYGAQLALLANGRLEDSTSYIQAQTTLRTFYSKELGYDIRRLELEVRQSVNIDTIGINLRKGNYAPPAREVELPIYLNRRLYGNSSVDLTQYIDGQRYYGYRIQSIEIQANAVYNSALIDVLLNSFSQGQTLQVGRYSSVVTAYLQNAVIGQNASNVMLSTRGDMDIQKVTLRLLPR